MDQGQFIQELQQQQPQTILILPFEDTTVEPLLRGHFPQSSFTVLRKQDLAGVPPIHLMRLLLKKRYDLVLASLYESAVHRSESSVQTLLCAVRAHLHFLRRSDNTYISLSRRHIIYRTLPQLLAAGILGSAAAALLFTFSFFSRLNASVPKQSSFNKKNKTILFLRTDLSGSLAAGGSVSHVKGMIGAFERTGYEVIYIADARIDALPAHVKQIVIQPIQFLDVFDEFQLIAYNFQLLRHAKKWKQEYSPAFLYQRHSIFGIAGGIIARRLHIPCILEVNASEVWVKTHWSRLFFVRLGKRCEALALHLADKVAVISEGVRNQLAPYHVPNKKIIYNPNGVDENEFHPNISGGIVRAKFNLTNAIVVGFIGTFTRWHGVETLFEAAVHVVQRDRNIFFLLIGDGDLRSSLQYRTKKLGIDDHLIFTGLIQHSEAALHLAACDILVSPHLGFENKEKFFGSPTKLFEYMAMGKAIIASNLEQIGEVIHDGVSGLLVEPGNAEELTQKILLLANNPQLRESLGKQARKDAEEKYTWEKNAQRVLNSLDAAPSS